MLFLPWLKICLILIILLSAGMRLKNLRQPLDDAFGWREASTAMMAENLPKNSWNPLWPQVNWTGDQVGYQGREFQTLTFVAAALNAVFGIRDWHGRVVAVLFGLLTTFALYGLVAALRSPNEGLAAASIYAVSPGAVMVDRSYLPDPAMVSLLTTALWCLVTGLQNVSKPRIIISGILGILAVLAKPTAAVTLPAALYLIIHVPQPAGRTCRMRLFWLWLCAALSVAGAYFAWAIYLGRTYPPFHVAGDWGTTWIAQAADLFYVHHFILLATTWLWTPLILFLTLLGALASIGAWAAATARSQAPLFFPIWLLGCLLFYFCISRELVSNPWNFHVADPALAAMAGTGMLMATGMDRDGAPASRGRWSAVIVIAIVVVGCLENLKEMKQGYTYALDRRIGEWMALLSGPDDLVVVSGEYAGNPLSIYYSKRKGWVFPAPPGEFRRYDLEPDEAIRQLSEMRHRGARWFGLAKGAHDMNGRRFEQRYAQVISYLDREGSVVDEGDFRIYALPAIGP
jgi:hypothetical protein